MKYTLKHLTTILITAAYLTACSNKEQAQDSQKTDTASVKTEMDTVAKLHDDKTEKYFDALPPPPEAKTHKFIPPLIKEEPYIEEDPQYRYDKVEENVILSADPPLQASDNPIYGDDFAYSVVEQVAVFPGGEEALKKYIYDNLVYPEDARDNEIEGTCRIKFKVKDDGRIYEPMVSKSSGHKPFDYEAIRVIKSMPKWKPAQINGKNVSSYFELPITFQLD